MPAQRMDTLQIDHYSVRGSWAWEIVADTCLPCLLRDPGAVKYVPISVGERKVLNRFLQHFTSELFECVDIESYPLTVAEICLLNFINKEYCNNSLHSGRFTKEKEIVVRLDDFRHYVDFLDTCYRKLKQIALADGQKNRCGFIRLNRESVVPYVAIENVTYLPLFYFEGDTAMLSEQTIDIRGWDLAYLKFCCKIQGIRNSIFGEDECAMIPLDAIKKYFPEGTVFQDYWPAELRPRMLISNNSNCVNGSPCIMSPSNASLNAGSITVRSMINEEIERSMNGAVPVNTPAPQNNLAVPRIRAPVARVVSQIESASAPCPIYPFQSQRYAICNGINNTTSRMPTPSIPNPQPLSHTYIRPSNFPTNQERHQEAQSTVLYSNGSLTDNEVVQSASVMRNKTISQSKINRKEKPTSPVITQQAVPPIRIIRAHNGSFTTECAANSLSTRNRFVANTHKKKRSLDMRPPDAIIDLISPPSSPCPPSLDNIKIGPNESNILMPELLPLPSIPGASYDITTDSKDDLKFCVLHTVSGSSVQCPDPLIPLCDIVKGFNSTMEQLRYKLQNVLKITLYQANKEQQQLLYRYKKCTLSYKELPMILLNDFKFHFKHLQYLHANESQQQTKKMKFAGK